MRYLKTLMGLFTAAWLLAAVPAQALDNQTLDKLFDDFTGGVSKLTESLAKQDWDSVESLAADLQEQAKNLAELGSKDDNPHWAYDSSNLHKHSTEMVEAVAEKDGAEAIYLVSVLLSHIGYIQSANTQWLKEYVGRRIELVERGVRQKNQDMVIDGGESLHVSANKMVFSAVVGEEAYRHTRWIEGVRRLNGLGDILIGDALDENWEAAEKHIAEARLIYRKWVKSFK